MVQFAHQIYKVQLKCECSLNVSLTPDAIESIPGKMHLHVLGVYCALKSLDDTLQFWELCDVRYTALQDSLPYLHDYAILLMNFFFHSRNCWV